MFTGKSLEWNATGAPAMIAKATSLARPIVQRIVNAPVAGDFAVASGPRAIRIRPTLV